MGSRSSPDPLRPRRPAISAGSRRATSAALAAVLVAVAVASVPCAAVAQDAAAAVVVEWDGRRAATLRETLRANLAGRGFGLLSEDAVAAARAFSGLEGALTEEGAQTLRARLEVRELVWVTVRPERRRLLLAVRRVTPDGVVPQYGAGEAASVSSRALSLLDAAFGAAAVVPSPPPDGPAPAAPTPSSGATATAPAPAPPADGTPGATTAPPDPGVPPSQATQPSAPAATATSAPDARPDGEVPSSDGVSAEAPEATGPAPSATSVPEASPAAPPAGGTPGATAEASSAPSSASDAAASLAPADGAAAVSAAAPPSAPRPAAPGDEAPHATADPPAAGVAVNGPARSAPTAEGPGVPPSTPPAAAASGATSPPEGATPGSTERLRLAIVAFAGIELYGYGAGARLELPLLSPIDGMDDSLSLGVGLGLAFADVGLDSQGNGYEAFQIPANVYATWRFGLGGVEIGPRVGAALILSLGGFRGPRLTGTRVSLIGMLTVGSSVAFEVAEGVQLYGALDLGFGPRVNGIITAGVAL
jgi:hypothetical protein